MKIITAHYIIEDEVDGQAILKKIEKAGRTAYKSEDLITFDSAKDFVKQIVSKGHLSVIEHISLSVRVVCDRGISHEIVRHRIASYTQESTRFCNYSKGKHGNQLTFIKPCFWKSDNKTDKDKYEIWLKTNEKIEKSYLSLIRDYGATPEEARSILPNSLKTEIVMTMNLREWRHFFVLRTSEAAHPQMKEISIPLLNDFKKMIPIVFDDIRACVEDL